MTHLKLLLSSLVVSSLIVAPGCGDPDAGSHPDAPVAPDPARLQLAVAADKLPILQGTTATLAVTVTRLADVTGAIVVAPVGLPPGVIADPLTIGADATTGTLTLHADPAAAHSLPTAVAIRGIAGTLEATAPVTVTVYGPPGSLDTSFGGGKLMIPAGVGDDYANAIAVQPDGKLVIAGRGAEHLGDFALIRLERDGALDATFGQGGRVLTDFAGASETAYAIALQADGKIVVAGTSTLAATGNDFALARYLPDGTLDPSFGTGGKVTTALGTDADTAYALVIQPDGKIVVGGDSSRAQSGLDFALARYTTSGALDATFGTGGIALTSIASNGGRDSIYALALQTIGGEPRIIAAGGEGDFTVARYLPSGALDASFGSGGKVSGLLGSTIGAARAIQVTPTGAIAIAGHAQHDVAVVRLTSAGAFDASFGTGGKVTTRLSTTNWNEAQGAVLEADGKLVVAGWVFEGGSSAGNFAVLRYRTDGVLDPTFGDAGIVITHVAPGTKGDQGMAVTLQVDDRVPAIRVVTAGNASDSNSDFAVTRYWR